jgi:hypothetical protein
MKAFVISSPKTQSVTNKKEFMILKIIPIVMVVEKSSFDFALGDFNCIIVA